MSEREHALLSKLTKLQSLVAQAILCCQNVTLTLAGAGGEVLILGCLEETGRMLHTAGVSLHVAQERLQVPGQGT